MKTCEKNVFIVFFISLFILTSLCVLKLHKKSNKIDLAVNSNTKIISNTKNDKKTQPIEKNKPKKSKKNNKPNRLKEKPKNHTFAPKIKYNKCENFINKRNAISQTAYYIWVNTTIPKTYIFKGYNHHWKLIKFMPCTVGKNSSPTIKGTFKVGNKGKSFIVKNNPKLMCKYFTQIHGNYLFHTVLLNRNGTIANGTLGAKISHGCIRLSIKNAKYIYNNIPSGSTIYIN